MNSFINNKHNFYILIIVLFIALSHLVSNKLILPNNLINFETGCYETISHNPKKAIICINGNCQSCMSQIAFYEQIRLANKIDRGIFIYWVNTKSQEYFIDTVAANVLYNYTPNIIIDTSGCFNKLNSELEFIGTYLIKNNIIKLHIKSFRQNGMEKEIIRFFR